MVRRNVKKKTQLFNYKFKIHFQGYGELIAALTRLQSQLSKSGLSTLAGRVSAAHNVLASASVAHVLAARTAVLQRRRPRVGGPCTTAPSACRRTSWSC